MEVPTTVYSSYTEAQKRATKKYRENNKDKVNLQRKKYYEERKAKDPSFLEQKRNKAKLYYQKKKAEKALAKTLSLEVPITDPLEEDAEGIELKEIPQNKQDIELPPFPHLEIEPVNDFIIESSSEPVIEKPKRKSRTTKTPKVNLKLEDLVGIEFKAIEDIPDVVPPEAPKARKSKVRKFH
jgi:hypothetical protein